MLVLGLDTSSPAVSAALVEVTADGCRELASSVVVDGRRHGELLAVGVREVLAGAGPLDAIVVGTGPGPFTGLRVGLVTAATTADALGVPAYGVCSLDAIAAEVSATSEVVAVADARRREVYWARYTPSGERLDGPAVVRPAELAAQLLRLPTRPLLVGAGAVLHRETLDGLEVAEQPLHPSAAALVRLARDRVLQGAPSDPLTPLYLRRPDAVEPGAVKRVTA